MGSEDVTESVSWNCWIQTFVASLGALVLLAFVGVIEAQSAVMLSQLRAPDSFIHVTPDEETWIASLGVVMAPVSSLIVGPFIDAFGRKRGLQVFFLNMGLGFAVMACASRVYHIYIGRIICGLGSGFLSCTYIYIVEMSTTKQREIFFSMFAVIFPGAIMVSNIMNSYMSWNIAACIFSLVCFVFFLSQFFIPESPAWLFKIGDEDGSIYSLKCLGRNKAEIENELDALKLSSSVHSARFAHEIALICQELDNLILPCDFDNLEEATARICQHLDILELHHNVDSGCLERIRLALLELSPSSDEIIETVNSKSPPLREVDAQKPPTYALTDVLKRSRSSDTLKLSSSLSETDNQNLPSDALPKVLKKSHSVNDTLKLSNTESESSTQKETLHPSPDNITEAMEKVQRDVDNLKLSNDVDSESLSAQSELDTQNANREVSVDNNLKLSKHLPESKADNLKLSNDADSKISQAKSEQDNLSPTPVDLEKAHSVVDTLKLSNLDSKSPPAFESDTIELPDRSQQEDALKLSKNTQDLKLSPGTSATMQQPHSVIDTSKLSKTDSRSLWVRRDTYSPKLFHTLESFDTLCEIHRELDNLTLSHDTSTDTLKFSSFLAPTIWKPFAIMVVFCILQSASGVYVIIFYSVDFFERLGTSYDPVSGSTLLCTTRFLSSATIGIIFRSKIGRKFSTAFSAGWMTVALIGVGVYDYVLRDVSVAERPHQWLPVAFLVLYMAVMVFGLLTLPWIMSGEVFPLRVRGTMAGATNAVGYLLMFISTKVYYVCVDALQIWGLLFAFAGAAFVAIFFGAFVLPETKGKSLYEIERGFLPKSRRASRGSRGFIESRKSSIIK